MKFAVASLDIHGNQYTVESVENISYPVHKTIKQLNFIQAFYWSKIDLPKTFLKNYFGRSNKGRSTKRNYFY